MKLRLPVLLATAVMACYSYVSIASADSSLLAKYLTGASNSFLNGSDKTTSTIYNRAGAVSGVQVSDMSAVAIQGGSSGPVRNTFGVGLPVVTGGASGDNYWLVSNGKSTSDSLASMSVKSTSPNQLIKLDQFSIDWMAAGSYDLSATVDMTAKFSLQISVDGGDWITVKSFTQSTSMTVNGQDNFGAQTVDLSAYSGTDIAIRLADILIDSNASFADTPRVVQAFSNLNLTGSLLTVTDASRYRVLTDDQTANWEDAAWSSTSGGAADQAWEPMATAYFAAGAGNGSIINIATAVSASGVELSSGKLTVQGAGSLAIKDQGTVKLGAGTTLALNKLSILGNGNLAVTLGNNADLALGSEGSRLAVGQYTLTMTNGTDSVLRLFTSGTREATNTTFVSLANPAGLKDVYYRGALMLNKTGSSTDLFNIGSTATLHLNGALVIRGGITDPTQSVFSNNIELGGGLIFSTYSGVKALISSNITMAPGLTSGPTMTKEGFGAIYFSGNVDFTSTGGKSMLALLTGTMGLVGNGSMTIEQVRIGDGNTLPGAGDDGIRRFTLSDTSTLTITGSSNPSSNSDWGSASFLLAHYMGGTTVANQNKVEFIMTGGTVNSLGARLYMAKDGYSVVSMTGQSTMNLKGIIFTKSGNTRPGNNFYVGADVNGVADDSAGSNPVLNLGSDGIIGMNTSDGDKGKLYLGKATVGTLGSSWETTSSGTLNSITLISTAGTTFRPDAGYTITLNHSLTGIGKLIVEGDGTLALTQNSNYTGGTVLKKGTLKLASSSSVGSQLTLMRGNTVLTGTGDTFKFDLGTTQTMNIQGTTGQATLTGDLNFAGGQFTLDIGALTASGPNNGTAYFQINGAVSVETASKFALVGDMATLTLGDYVIATATGGILGVDASTLSSIYLINGLQDYYSYSISTSGNNLILTVASALEPITWDKAGGGAWNTTETNWKTTTGGAPKTFKDGTFVSFVDLSASGNIQVTLADTVVPGQITFDNSANDYTLSGNGSLAGAGDIIKKGTGTVTLDLSNPNYAGSVEFIGGSLVAKKADSLGAGNVKFSGGTLGLDFSGDLNLASVGGDQAVKLNVTASNTVNLTTGTGGSLFYSKDITLTGGGSLVLNGPKGTTYAGMLTNTGSNLTLNAGVAADTVTMTGGFTGVLNKTGAGTLNMTNVAFNNSNGELVVKEGTLVFISNGSTNAYTNSNVNITMEDNTVFDLTNDGKTRVTATGTLKLGAGTQFVIRNGNSDGRYFDMSIVLTGGVDKAATEIRGFNNGEYITISKAITGTGNLKILRHITTTTGYHNNPLSFIDGWQQNTYVGSTEITASNVYWRLGSNVVVQPGAVLTPWGVTTNAVTIGGSTVQGTNVEIYGVASTIQSFELANDITFSTNGNGATLRLFASAGSYGLSVIDTKSSAKLTGTIEVVKTGEAGSSNIYGSASLEFAKALKGSADLGVTMQSADKATNQVLLTGDNKSYTGKLNVSGAGVVKLSSTTDKTFGGSLATNGAHLSVAGAGQIISGNLDLTYTPATGSATTGGFIFAGNSLSAGTTMLTAGSLTLGDAATITLDFGAGNFIDGSYTLISYTGDLTGGFDLSKVNWLGGTPTAGTFTLSFDPTGKMLTLLISGVSSQVWYGSSATPGTGTWKKSANGWGTDGADLFASNGAVMFNDVGTATAGTVTIDGDVDPTSVKIANDRMTLTFAGSGKIVDSSSGATTLVKQGAGEAILANASGNTFSGGTTVENGTLTLQADGALGTGVITLKGGTLKLDKSGNSLLAAGNKLVFNGGSILYTVNATQDVSTLIDAASTGTVKVGVVSGHSVSWSKAVNDINLALTKTDAGSLNLNLTGALTKLITVSAGSLKLNVNASSLDASMLAGASTANATLINKGGAAVAVSGTTAFAGNLTLNSTSATDTSKGFNLSTMSNLNSVSQLTLDNVAITLGAGASFGKTIAITTGASFNGGSATLSGSLTGTGALTLVNTTVTLTGDATGYTGAITNNATLNFGNGTAATLKDGAFIGSTALNGTGAYAVNYTNATSLAAIVGGTASLTQKGSGILSLTGANTSTGTLTIDQNTTVDLAQGGSWAGSITGAGTLQVSSNASMDLSNLSGATSLKQTGTGTITLNHGTPGSYTGDIAITGGGTLDLQKAYGNKITMNKGNLVNGSNASNVHVEATGNVDLGGVSGSSIKSLNSTESGSLISGITGSINIASSSLKVGVNNLSTTEGSEGNPRVGTPIVSFTDGTTADLTVTGTLTLKVDAAALEAFLTAASTRDLYVINVTNGTLNADSVDFDNYLENLGYRYEGIEGGDVKINGQSLQTPYLVKMGEERTITNPSELDIYPSVVNQGIWNIDIDPGRTIVVKELEGRAGDAMINTGKAGSTVELSNNKFVDGTGYAGSIRGDANITKTGQYGLTIGGSVQTSGNLGVEGGSLTIGGPATVSGTTTVKSQTSLNMGGPLQTGAFIVESNTGLNMNGGGIALTGHGMVSSIADGVTLTSVGGISVGSGTHLTIGSNVNMGGAVLDWSATDGGSLTTSSDISLLGLNGNDGTLTMNNRTLTLTGDGNAEFRGQLIGSTGGVIVKQGSGTQILATTTNNANTSLDVRSGEVLLKKNNNSTQDIAWNTISVARGATLSIGGNTPGDGVPPSTAYVSSANFANGSTLNMVIPTEKGGISSTGTITLPTSMTLGLVNNGTFDFGNPPKDFTVMTADGGYLWGDGNQLGQIIGKGTVFNDWKVTLEKSISLFYGSADIYLAADGKTLMATPIAAGRNSLIDVAQSANAMAGANMLWAAGLQPTGTNLDLLLSSIMDDVKAGNNASASRKMAASVGSTYTGMLSAQQAGFRYQQTLIRNRMTGMGLNQDYNYKGELPMYNAWIQGNGSYDKLDSRGDEAGFDLNTWGGTVGFDMNITPRWTIGAAFTASYGDLKSSAADSLDGNLDMYYVNLFAQYKQKKWTHAFILTGAWGEADVTRTVSYGDGMYRGQGKTDANSYGAMYELIYDIAMNEDSTTILQPLFNASIQKNKMDGFSETGAGNAGLNVENMDSTTGSLSAGARLLGLIGSNVFGRESVGEVRAQLVQDLGADRSEADMAYQANPGFTQRIRGSKVGSTGVQFGVGLTIPVGQQGSVFAEGNVDLRSHATSANGSIGYRYNF